MTDMFASESRVPGGASAEGAPQPGDVTGALTELERKLRELQQELSSIGRRRATDEPTAASAKAEDPAGAATATPAVGRIVDEALGGGDEALSGGVRPIASTPPQASANAVPTGSTAQPGEALAAKSGDARLESLAELRRFRDRLERFGRELATEYDELLGRVMAGLSGACAPAAQGIASASPTATAPPVSEEDARESALFEGRVELGVGPFYDIGALGAFEQRLSSLPGVGEASVRRFEASHAVVDVRLTTPVALVKELRHALNTDFSVREVAGGRVLLTFDDA